MINRRRALLAGAAGLSLWAADERPGSRGVRILRVPQAGIQPQAAGDAQGTIHLVYFAGDPANGDVFYAKSADGGTRFSTPIRVNSQPGSAIALGTIRGPQMAVGKNGRIHVAWNGSQHAEPAGPVNPDSGKPGTPMLYSRLNDAGTAFEPQRNLMLHSFGLDGGGSVAADSAGNVLVAWHGIGESEADRGKGEARRAVWLARSADHGRSFAREAKAWAEPTGACGCCGMKVHADAGGSVTALYRSATESVHRDMYLLRSADRGETFRGRLLQTWNINACPMSSMDIADNAKETVAAWETGGQVYWSRIDGKPDPIAAPGDGKGRKHPRIAIDANGEVLLAWTEGTGWQKGGGLAWQRYDRARAPAGEVERRPGIPTWSFAAAVAGRDGFTILY
jgi:hypothetical protein